jgi:chemotaxis protein MotB
MTDLMTGLVLVFMVLFFWAYMEGQTSKIQEQVAQYSVSEEMKQALNEQNIEATVEASGVVRIQNLELFDVGSSKLSNKGKQYLNKFTPIYLNSIFSNEILNKNIDKIVIEGHTDSQSFIGKYSADEQYMKNMELSLNRAYEVANYMSKTSYNKEQGDRLRKMIVVSGASFANPIVVNNKEDYNKSRRVELKLVMKNSPKK